MRQIDVNNYTVTLPNSKAGEELQDGSLEPATVDIPYRVKDSLIEILFARDNQLGGREILERDKLAHKILESDGVVMLEEADWQKMVAAIEAVKGLGRTDVELVHRILDAEQIEVEEKRP